MPNTRHYILGTAGHIDHGKTRLVRALTGTDTDRLPEERRRGMTIELGFAELTLDRTRLGIVDVPGHERFVRMMVAGATGIDLALIVVAADDSVMPQTIEHVEILHLLGIQRAVVAVTKTDIVEPGMVDLVVDDVTSLLADSPLEGSPIVPVSSATGSGLDALKHALLKVADGVPPRRRGGPFHMAVDRVFTVQGRGTVVTGSTLRGTVQAGDTLEVWPMGATCRVRDLQTHGIQEEKLQSGQRAAINISGIDRDQLRRGIQLATPGYLQPSRMMDVKLWCLASRTDALKSTTVVRLGIGTLETPARVVLLEGGAIEPGASAYAQLRSGQPLTATYGQRFIIRNENDTRTIGGGIVLRPIARRRRRDPRSEILSLELLERGDAADRLEDVLRIDGFDRPTDLRACARAGIEPDQLQDVYDRLISEKRWCLIVGTDTSAVPAALDEVTQRLSSWLERHHRSQPESPGRHIDSVLGWLERRSDRVLARPLLDRLIRQQTVKLLGRWVCLPAFAPKLTAADEKLMTAMIEEIRAAAFQPPSLDTLHIASQADRKRWDRLATLAVALGDLVQIDGRMYLHAEIEQRMRTIVTDLVHRTNGVTVAEIREALNSSRKFVVPFLEYLDRIGFTRRIGDRRVLASASSGG